MGEEIKKVKTPYQSPDAKIDNLIKVVKNLEKKIDMIISKLSDK